MKKYIIMALAALSLSFISCKDKDGQKVDSYIEKINDAIENDDFKNAVELYKELRSYMKGLDVDEERKIMKELGEEKLKEIDDLEGIIYQGCMARGIPFGPDEAAAKAASEEEAGEAIEETGGGDPFAAFSDVIAEAENEMGIEAAENSDESANAQMKENEETGNPASQNDDQVIEEF